MNKSDQRIRKFNPGTFLSDEEVIEQFVVRKRELGIVLEVLRGNIDSPSCQHVLVVAPRGRGKTMLLARIAAELNTDDGLSECLLPVRFMEESHEVLNIADFWLETLFHLARESARHDPTLAQELREDARRSERSLAREGTRRSRPCCCPGRIGPAGQKTRSHGRKSTVNWRRTWMTISAGSYAACCNQSLRSCCSPPRRVASRVWTTRSSRSSSSSEYWIWNH